MEKTGGGRGMIYRIRPHHGMCFAFFTGKGYNDTFTENMRTMKEALDNNPEVILLCGTDDVCARCPNNLAGKCTDAVSGESSGKAESYDRQVLAYCGLPEGAKIRWKDFTASVYDNILTAGKRVEICGDCEWNGLCN